MTTAIITAAIIVALAILALAAVVIKTAREFPDRFDKGLTCHNIGFICNMVAQTNEAIKANSQAMLAAALLFPDNLRNGDILAAVEKVNEAIDVINEKYKEEDDNA